MSLKSGILVLSLWTLLLVPLLCGGGLLIHSCVCDDSTECHHELSCTADPCQIPLVGPRTVYVQPHDFSSPPVFPSPALDATVSLPNPELRAECFFNTALLPTGLIPTNGTLPLLC